MENSIFKGVFQNRLILIVIFLSLMPCCLYGHEADTGRHLELDAEKGVVVDRKYNLMWESKTSSNADYVCTWYEAFDYVDALNDQCYAGYCDWRLPSAMEYTTIVDLGKISGPSIETDFFPFNGNFHYWTISEYSPIPSVVQYTSFVSGNQFKWGKEGQMRVRCVRGGGWTACYPGNTDDFVDTGLTVIDNVTGLEWEQKAEHGDDPFMQGPVLVEIARLLKLAPDIPLWLDELINKEFGASGFMDYQEDVPDGVISLLMDIPHLLWTFSLDLLRNELVELSFEGKSFLGNRSFLMFFDYPQAAEYIDWLNEMDVDGDGLVEGYAGFNDWRMPTVGEIVTTTDWERVPCCKEVFSPTFTWLYWTSTEDPVSGRHYFT